MVGSALEVGDLRCRLLSVELISQRNVSQSWLFTSASMPLEVRQIARPAGGRPGPCVGFDHHRQANLTRLDALCSRDELGIKATHKADLQEDAVLLEPRSMIASHSARMRAIGFSRKTCLPSAAASAQGRWVKVGVVMMTASKATLSSASSREVKRSSLPNASPVAARTSATGSTSATIFAPGCLPERANDFLPTRPVPIMQMRTGAFSSSTTPGRGYLIGTSTPATATSVPSGR